MGRSSRVWYCVPAGWKKTDIPFDSQKTRVYTPRSFLSVIMMNIAFITCFVGVLGMCAGASLAEGKPWSGEKVPLAEDGAVVLDDNEYLLNLADYEKLEQGGGLLVRYAAGKNGLREDSGAFYFENSHGKMVSAAMEPVSGNAGKTEPERLALVSPAFPLNPEGKWSLMRSMCIRSGFVGVSFPFSIPENTIIKAEHIKCCHGGNACHYPSHNRIELEAGSQNFVFREKT